MREATSIIVLFLTAGVALAAPPEQAAPATRAIQAGYSTKPLERPVFDQAQVAVETVRFNNWLVGNYDSLDAQSVTGAREHLYYLIDSWVKNIYARDKVVFPKTHDGVLQTFFSWSERLGVFGGHLVFNALKSDDLPEMQPLMPVPRGMDLILENDTLVVSAEDWSVAVPYYFMIWNINDFVAKDGPRTQLLVVSTGASVHDGLDGHSQATLMLLFGPGADGADFIPYWTKQLGFAGNEREIADPSQPRSTRYRYDESQKLHHEYAAWNSTHGQFVVAYSGINGTYQWNRPHFLDFLRAIQERGSR